MAEEHPDGAGQGEEGSGTETKGNPEVEGLRSGLLAERRKRQELEREIEKIRSDSGDGNGSQQQEPTWADYEAAVDAGRMTEAQARAAYDDQREKRIKRETAAEVASTLEARQREEQLQSDLDRYMERIPALLDESSDEFRRAEAEARHFSKLTGKSVGAVETQVAALRATFGPPDRIAKPGKRPAPAHEDTGGGDDDDDGDDTRVRDGLPKGLNARERKHYSALVERGIYTLAEVKADVEFREKQRKARA